MLFWCSTIVIIMTIIFTSHWLTHIREASSLIYTHTYTNQILGSSIIVVVCVLLFFLTNVTIYAPQKQIKNTNLTITKQWKTPAICAAVNWIWSVWPQEWVKNQWNIVQRNMQIFMCGMTECDWIVVESSNSKRFKYLPHSASALFEDWFVFHTSFKLTIHYSHIAILVE